MPGILMPNLGYATREGVVLSWLKGAGDPVEAGESLVEIAMEKTVHVVVAGRGGVLLAVYAAEGAVVPEGETIAWIGEADEMPPRVNCRLLGWEEEIAPAPDNLAELLNLPAASGAVPPKEPDEPDEQEAASGEGVIPLESTGKQERSFLRNQLRHVTAQRMAKSWIDAPKVDLFAEVDFSQVQAHRRALKEKGTERPSFNVYIAHAVAKAFEDLPQYNIKHRNIKHRDRPLREVENEREECPRPESIDVAMAVALGDNLVTVSMKDLGGAGLQEIQRRFKGLIKKALRMSLRREELYASSLTVTNLGEFEISAFTAVINPPETFILAIGMVEERPVVRDGEVVVATMCTFCLSFDHRFIDGGPASRVLQRIKHHMEGEQGPL